VVELKGYSRSIRLPALLIASAIFPSLLWIISRINSISCLDLQCASCAHVDLLIVGQSGMLMK